jgi:predicted MFS family arabinose efflux permease
MNAANESLWVQLSSFPRAVWILFLGTFLNKFGTFVIPFLAIYLTGQGFSPSQIGLAIGTYGFGGLLASLAGGQLAHT